MQELQASQEQISYAQFVLEFRVRPGSYRLGVTSDKPQGNTLWGPPKIPDGWPGGGQGLGVMGKPMVFDKHCINQSMEWIMSNPGDVVVTGVMIRYIDDHPKEFIKKHTACQKLHTGWQTDDGDKTGTYTRPRDHGGAGSKVHWEYNNNTGRAHGRGRTTCRRDDNDWEPFDNTVSAIIETAYQQYQRFCYIGDVKCGFQAAPRFVDFMEWSCDGTDGRRPAPAHYRDFSSGAMLRRADVDSLTNVRAVRRVVDAQ